MVQPNSLRSRSQWAKANTISAPYTNKQELHITAVGQTYPVTVESNEDGTAFTVTLPSILFLSTSSPHGMSLCVFVWSVLQVKYKDETIKLETRWPIFSHLINLTIDGKPLLFQYLDHLAEGFVVQLYGTKVGRVV